MDDFFKIVTEYLKAAFRQTWVRVVFISLLVLLLLWLGSHRSELETPTVTLLQSVIESSEFRSLVIGVITVGIALLANRSARIKIRTENMERVEKQRTEIEAQAEQDKAALERQHAAQIVAIEIKSKELLNQSLEDAFARVKLAEQKYNLKAKEFDAKVKDHSDLQAKYNQQQIEIGTLRNRVSECETSIEKYQLTAQEKDRIINELTDNQSSMSERLDALEKERDEWKALAEQRAGELKQRDDTITNLKGKLDETEKEVQSLKKRLDDIEDKGKKSDTSEVVEVKVQPEDGEKPHESQQS